MLKHSAVEHPQLKYKEIEQKLRELTRALPIGAKIPPEKRLALNYGCNFQTVRKALKSLVEDGIIVRRIGSGSFIARNADSEKEDIQHHNSDGSKRLGLLVYHRSNDYAQKILQMITQAAPNEGFVLESAWISDFKENGLQKAKSLAQQGCKAIVLPWFPYNLHAEVRELLEKCPIPISMPAVLPGFESNFYGRPETFGNSIFTTTESLCDYFLALKKSKIALLGPSTIEDPILTRQLTAYSVYVSKHQLPNLTHLATVGSASMDQIAAKLKEHRGEVGVLCYDDEHALRLMTAMHKVGLKAPKDYAIIGHNDTDSSRYSDPPLSTQIQDYSEVGENLLKKAWALHLGINYQAKDNRRPRLLIRDTCGGKGKIDQKLRKKLPDIVLVELSAD